MEPLPTTPPTSPSPALPDIQPSPSQHRGRFRAWWDRRSYTAKGMIIGFVINLLLFSPLGLLLQVSPGFFVLGSLEDAFGWELIHSDWAAFPDGSLAWTLFFLSHAFFGGFVGSLVGVVKRPRGQHKVQAVIWRCLVVFIVVLLFINLSRLRASLPSLGCGLTKNEAREECYYNLFRKTGNASMCIDLARTRNGSYSYFVSRCITESAQSAEECALLIDNSDTERPSFESYFSCIRALAKRLHDPYLCFAIPPVQNRSVTTGSRIECIQRACAGESIGFPPDRSTWTVEDQVISEACSFTK